MNDAPPTQAKPPPERLDRDRAEALALAIVGMDLIGVPGLGAAASSSSIGLVLFPVILSFLIGQIGLLMIWSVFGRRALLARLPLSIVTGMGFYVLFILAMFAPMVVGTGSASPFLPALVVPLVLLAGQLPLWPLRLVFRWSVPSIDGSVPSARQFRIQDMLVFTTVAAAALGLARVAIADAPVAEAWWSVLAACLGSVVFAALVLLPSIWAALIVNHLRTGLGAIAIYVLVLTATLSALPAFAGAPPGISLLMFLLYLFFLAILFGIVCGGLCVVRFCGYRLERVRHPAPK